jgi:hypothetical protein
MGFYDIPDGNEVESLLKKTFELREVAPVSMPAPGVDKERYFRENLNMIVGSNFPDNPDLEWEILACVNHAEGLDTQVRSTNGSAGYNPFRLIIGFKDNAYPKVIACYMLAAI